MIMNLLHTKRDIKMTFENVLEEPKLAFKMLAFNDDAKLKDKLLKQVIWHREQDKIISGSYGNIGDDNFRGCAVGCTLHSYAIINKIKIATNKHKSYELFGIPQLLARLEDGIFEGLPAKKQHFWPEQFISAIHVGADLSTVWPKFAVWLLTDKKHGVIQYAKNNNQLETIQRVADLYKKGATKKEFMDAAYAADDAADAADAADADVYAADAAAADAAYAAYAAAADAYAAAADAADAADAAYADVYAADAAAADAADAAADAADAADAAYAAAYAAYAADAAAADAADAAAYAAYAADADADVYAAAAYAAYAAAAATAVAAYAAAYNYAARKKAKQDIRIAQSKKLISLFKACKP